jgi:hypothetical protein
MNVACRAIHVGVEGRRSTRAVDGPVITTVRSQALGVVAESPRESEEFAG